MNLLRDSKLASSPVSKLEHNEVSEWRSGTGDWSRVLARAFEDQSPRAAALAGDRRSRLGTLRGGHEHYDRGYLLAVDCPQFLSKILPRRSISLPAS